MATATITRIYQLTLPDDSELTPDEVLSLWLKKARVDQSVFDCLVQDDVDGIVNEGYVP